MLSLFGEKVRVDICMQTHSHDSIPAVNQNGVVGRFLLNGVDQIEGVNNCPVAWNRAGATGVPVKHLKLGHFTSQAKLVAEGRERLLKQLTTTR